MELLKQKPTTYQPAPAKPDFFDQNLRNIGGINPYGEPNLKVTWGWDLRAFRNGDPQALKYPGPFLNRFILEKWLPVSFFDTPESWEVSRYVATADGKKIDLLGEFPARGQYGMVMPLTTSDGGFIPCTSAVLSFIDGMRQEFETRTLNVYSNANLYAQLQQQMETEQARLDEEASAEADELGDYYQTRDEYINRNPVYSLPGKSLWTPDGEVTLN